MKTVGSQEEVGFQTFLGDVGGGGEDSYMQILFQLNP